MDRRYSGSSSSSSRRDSRDSGRRYSRSPPRERRRTPPPPSRRSRSPPPLRKRSRSPPRRESPPKRRMMMDDERGEGGFRGRGRGEGRGSSRGNFVRGSRGRGMMGTGRGNFRGRDGPSFPREGYHTSSYHSNNTNNGPKLEEVPLPEIISKELSGAALQLHSKMLQQHGALKNEIIKIPRNNPSEQIYFNCLSAQANILHQYILQHQVLLTPGPRPEGSRPLIVKERKPQRPMPGGFPNGLYDKIEPQIAERYKAAGILVYTFVDGRPRVLLACEDRSKKKRYIEDNKSLAKVWLQFGGKREEGDTNPAETAIREFHKESLGLFKQDAARWNVERIRTPGDWRVLWKEEGKYALFLFEVPYEAKLSEKFLDLKSQLKTPTDHLSVKWIEYDKIDRAVNRKSTFIYEDSQELELFSFFLALMDCPTLSPFLSSAALAKRL